MASSRSRKLRVEQRSIRLSTQPRAVWTFLQRTVTTAQRESDRFSAHSPASLRLGLARAPGVKFNRLRKPLWRASTLDGPCFDSVQEKPYNGMLPCFFGGFLSRLV